MYNEVEYIGSLVKVDNGNIAAVTDGINTCINEYFFSCYHFVYYSIL